MDMKEENEVLEALYPEMQIWEGQKYSNESFPEQQTKQVNIKENHSSFVCEICGKAFSQRSGLTHHIPMHSDIKAFQCSICGKSFRQRSGLTHHKQTHSVVKAFSCNICGKLFSQGSGLIHHKSTHSLVKNFSCNICGKKFAQRSGLAHHKSIHVKHTGNTPPLTANYNIVNNNPN